MEPKLPDPAPVTSVMRAVNNAASPKGRAADKLALLITVIAIVLTLIMAGLFFTGFIANDNHLEAVISALLLTIFLASFAIGPLIAIGWAAHKAYHFGGNFKLYLRVFLLIMPWLILLILCLLYTPITWWVNIMALVFAALLTFWASFSMILEVKASKNRHNVAI